MNYTSIGMLIITLLLLVILGIAGLALHNARTNNNFDSLPELEVVEDRTSTTNTRTTTTTTRTTEVITSPYYHNNLDDYLNDPIYTDKVRKSSITLNLLTNMATEADRVFNIEDMTMINTDAVIKNAKSDEADHIVTGGNDYAIIYDSDILFEKLFTKKFISEMIYYKYDNKPIFVIYRDNYYRLASLNMPTNKIINVMTTVSNNKQAKASVKYKTETIEITLIYEDDRWKIDEYSYPGYTKELPEEPTTNEEGV